MPVTEDPVSLRKAAQIRTTRIDEIIEEIISTIDDIENQRSPWQQKLARLYRQRYGIRGQKTFPWPGASDLHMPLIDRNIRRLKAMFVRLVTAAYPICTISAKDLGVARSLEMFLEWLLRCRMSVVRQLTHLVDLMLAFGKSYLKTTWNYETRSVTEKRSRLEVFGDIDVAKLPTPHRLYRIAIAYGLDPVEDRALIDKVDAAFADGADRAAVVHDIVVHDEPMWTVVHPLDLYCSAGTMDIERAQFVAHRMRVSMQQLRAKERAGFYENIDAIDAFAMGSRPTRRFDTLERDQNFREDVTFSADIDDVDIHECYCLHDINRDGVKERCVLTIHIPTKTKLRFVEYPYWHGMWPVTPFEYEITDGRWLSSRGVSELLEDIEKEMCIQHNAKIDSMSITNSPIGFYARNSGLKPTDITWTPGQFIPLANPQTDIVFPVIPSHEMSYEREEQILTGWAEDITGALQAVLTGQGDSRNPRTATEIEATQGESSSVFALDAEIFQSSMRRVYHQTLSLWQQFGPDETEVAVLGQDLPIKLTRKELAMGFDIIPTGTPANVNASMRLGRAIQFLQTLGQVGPVENVSIKDLVAYIAQLQDPTMARLVVARGGLTGSEQQVERQLDEVTRILTIPGYRAPLHPSDNDEIHAQVVQQLIQQGGQALAQSDAGTRLMEHGMAHQANVERKKPGGALRLPALDPMGRPEQQAPTPGELASATAGGGR